MSVFVYCDAPSHRGRVKVGELAAERAWPDVLDLLDRIGPAAMRDTTAVPETTGRLTLRCSRCHDGVILRGTTEARVVSALGPGVSRLSLTGLRHTLNTLPST